MNKFLALVIARNKEFYRDRGTLIWTFIFPFIVLAGFAYGYSGRSEPILNILAYPPTALDSALLKALTEIPGVKITPAKDDSVALKTLERYQTDMLISVATHDGGEGLMYSLHDDSEKGRLAEKLLLEAAEGLENPSTTLERLPVTGRRTRYADWLLPGLLAMNLMFGSMFGVGYVIVRYRKNGVLKRLRATPLSAFQFLIAQVFSRMLLMIVTSLLVLGGAMLLIGFRPQGSILDFVVFLAVSSTAMIAVGLVVASRIASEEVADGVLNMMTWPMIFLSGIWFSLDGANEWVQALAKIMPLTHVVEGLRGILNEGATLAQVVPQMAILLALACVLIAIGSLIFRWR